MKQMRESIHHEQIDQNYNPYLAQSNQIVESVVISEGEDNEMVLDLDMKDEYPDEINPYIDEYAVGKKVRQPHLKKSKASARRQAEADQAEEPEGSSLVDAPGTSSPLEVPDTINPQDNRKSSGHKIERPEGTTSLRLTFKRPSASQIAESQVNESSKLAEPQPLKNVILEPEQEEDTPYSPGQQKEDDSIEFDNFNKSPTVEQRGSSDIEGYTPDCESAESDVN